MILNDVELFLKVKCPVVDECYEVEEYPQVELILKVTCPEIGLRLLHHS